MTKRSKFEAARRDAESVRMKEIEAAWLGSLSEADSDAFSRAVAAARAREARVPVNQPPGTLPNPPKREPRPRKGEVDRPKRY